MPGVEIHANAITTILQQKQIQQQVTSLLSLASVPQPDDTADALAVALCHRNSLRFAQACNTIST